MSITVIISHQVEDFDKWKIGFDVHESARAEAKMQARLTGVQMIQTMFT